MSSQPRFIEAPALLVEARFRERPLASRLLTPAARRGFSVGAARGADAPIDAVFLDGAPGNDNHLLVEPSGAGFLVNLSPAMRARLEDTPTGLRIPCGEVVFDISAASPAVAVPRPWLSARAKDFAPYVVGVMVVVALLLAIIQMVPSDPRALSLDDVGRNVRLDAYRIVPPVTPEPPSGKGGALAAKGAPAKSVAGAPGTAGDRRARPADGRRAHKGPPTASDARAVAERVVQGSILSVLATHRSDVLADVLAPKAALGSDADEVLGHLTAANIDLAYGGGTGPVGTGAGPAGTGEGLRGGDGTGLATIPGCRPGARCTGAGLRYGHDVGNFDGRRRPRVPEVITSGLVLRGSLDKSIVRRIVRAHLNEVRFCYEQSLVRRPALAGRVVANFTIANTGNVLASVLQSSTLGDPTAESCIVNAIRRWGFPKPEGGGLVIVSYPFQLSPAGG